MATDFASKYTNANLSKDASTYSWDKYQYLYQQVQDAIETKSLAAGIITVAACGQRRGDIVGLFFRDLVKSQNHTTEEIKQNAQLVGEAITLAIPFVGLPNVMPALFGLINELKSYGIESVSTTPDVTGGRGDIRAQNYLAKGVETSTSIYRGVGNSDVQEMVRQYFPGVSYYAHTTIFGYLIGNSPWCELKDAELIVTAAITALGATRQARSHCKGSIQLGNSVNALKTVVAVVSEIADWNRRPLPDRIDVEELSEELKRNLEKLQEN